MAVSSNILTEDPLQKLLERREAIENSFNDESTPFEEQRLDNLHREIEREIAASEPVDVAGVIARLALVRKELQRYHGVTDDLFAMKVFDRAVQFLAGLDK